MFNGASSRPPRVTYARPAVMPAPNQNPKFHQLQSEGYCVFPEVVEKSMCRRLRTLCVQLYDALEEGERAAKRTLGSLIPLWNSPHFADLIAHPTLLACFQKMGFEGVRFSNGYIVCKAAGSPRLFWHQDWWAWDDPCSYTPFVAQLGCLLYLQDTGPHNGCLTVIPGSHRKRHPLHRPTSRERNLSLRRGEPPDAPEFCPSAGELPLVARAGDLLVMDARLLHATYPNRSSDPRVGIVLWFLPQYDSCSDLIRGRLGPSAAPPEWPVEARRKIAKLLPEGLSVESPWGEAHWNPGPQLR